VRETAKITNAVYLISASKMRRAKENFLSANLFLDEVREAAKHLMSSKCATSHPFFQQREGNRVAYVIIGGDKGLCGDYNQLIINASDLSMKNKKVTNLFAVGTVIKDYYDKKEGIDVNNSYVHIFPDPIPEDARAIADDLCSDFIEQKMDKAYIIFTKADKLSQQKITIKKILPLDILDTSEEVLFLSEDNSFDNILKQYVWARIYQAICSSSYAENYKRMVSMQEATTNAGRIIDDLQKTYNQERQESITNALLDATTAHMSRNY
ncbi:MAG: F0F1 ATP synthase subunit gamma, partial [Clostridiales bacterium]|nr:F0F1 ATP synthase subunit gamma [Clostridiales bacterium]